MEWMHAVSALVALVAIIFSSKAMHDAGEAVRASRRNREYDYAGAEMPKSVTHVLQYRHLWPTQFERSIEYLVDERILKQSAPKIPPPMRVVIVADETKKES